MDKERKIILELRKSGISQFLGEAQHRGTGGAAQLCQLRDVDPQRLGLVGHHIVGDPPLRVGQLGRVYSSRSKKFMSVRTPVCMARAAGPI